MRTFSVCPSDWSHEHSVEDAIAIIRATFDHVAVDPAEGVRRANGILDRLRALNAPSVVQDVYVNGASQAVLVAVRVSPSDTPVDFIIVPGEGIQLRCPDGQDGLAPALAGALGYECEEL